MIRDHDASYSYGNGQMGIKKQIYWRWAINLFTAAAVAAVTLALRDLIKTWQMKMSTL